MVQQVVPQVVPHPSYSVSVIVQKGICHPSLPTADLSPSGCVWVSGLLPSAPLSFSSRVSLPASSAVWSARGVNWDWGRALAQILYKRMHQSTQATAAGE
jgi:hypothetical protein